MIYVVMPNDGHGLETAGKRTPVFPDGTQMKENEFNEPVSQFFGEEMKRCGVKVFYPAPEDTDVPLATRTNRGNAKYKEYCDKYGKENVKCIWVGIHANALTGQWGDWGGIGTYYHEGSVNGKRLAGLVQSSVIKGTPLRDRGIHTNNLHETRETNMPAVLVELGFMDNLKEATLLRTLEYRWECAVELAKATCEYFGIPYVPYVAPAPAPTVKPGKEIVKKLQSILNELNVTDKYGHKLAVDGRPGELTRSAVSKVVIKRGMKSPLIGWLQTFLNISVDNSYGNAPYHQTYDAIIKFQKAHKLKADGVVGPITWAAIIASL